MAEILSSSYLIGNEEFLPSAEFQNQFKEKKLYKIQPLELQSTFMRHPDYSRSLSLDGFMGLECLYRALSKIDISIDRLQTGIYTAYQNGPLLYTLLNSVHDMEHTISLIEFKKKWPPKQHFKQNAPLRATHAAMSLKIHGPQMCFVDPYTGLIDALEAAQIDLELGITKIGLVISAFCFDEIQSTIKYASSSNSLHESAVALILAPNKSKNICGELNCSIPFDKGQPSPLLNSAIFNKKDS